MAQRILTTNPQPQNDRLAALLRDRGAEVIQLPLHCVEPAADQGARLRAVLHRLDDIDWIVISSRPAPGSGCTQACVDRASWDEAMLPAGR